MAEQPVPKSPFEGGQMPAFTLSSEIRLSGKYVTLVALEQRDIPKLWSSLQPTSASESVLRHLPMTPPRDIEDFWNLIEYLQSHGFVLFAICTKLSKPSTDRASKSDINHDTEIVGMIGYDDISPSNRTFEIGAVLFIVLQRTTAATEAHYLMLKYAFEGDEHLMHPAYRRVAWKCNSANHASRHAAKRLGLTYEGTFRNHMFVNGVSRDSDWLSIVDDEWPRVKRALETWLDGSNLTDDGRQLRTLEQIRQESKIAEGV